MFWKGFIMMLDNATYNKVKTLHALSELCWFIEKHALSDAKKAGDHECTKHLEDLKKDLKNYIEKLQKLSA